MTPLSNYLQSNRERMALTQEEVGFLLGAKGEGKGIKVSRDEHSARKPGLHTLIAYEVIYDKPVRELFKGVYEEIEQEVAERARLLTYQIDRKPSQRSAHRKEMIQSLAARLSNNQIENVE